LLADVDGVVADTLEQALEHGGVGPELGGQANAFSRWRVKR
jgi:hypothetical protein